MQAQTNQALVARLSASNATQAELLRRNQQLHAISLEVLDMCLGADKADAWAATAGLRGLAAVIKLTHRALNFSTLRGSKGGTMAQFRVSQASTQRLTLEDAVGRSHLAHALHEVPPVGTLLHGPRPAPGFAILSDASSRQLCRVIFEHVDCGRSEPLVN